MPTRPDEPSQAAAYGVAALLLGSGIGHFLTPKFFDAIVPRALPGSARSYTYGSGVAEIVVAGALIAPPTRRTGGLLAALLFVAVFPANIQMAADWLRSSRTTVPMKIAVLARLPLQIPMVTQALRARRNAP